MKIWEAVYANLVPCALITTPVAVAVLCFIDAATTTAALITSA